jgi:hypothetical protein
MPKKVKMLDTRIRGLVIWTGTRYGLDRCIIDQTGLEGVWADLCNRSNGGRKEKANVQGEEDEGLVGLLPAAGYTGRGIEVARVFIVVLRGEDEGSQPAMKS